MDENFLDNLVDKMKMANDSPVRHSPTSWSPAMQMDYKLDVSSLSPSLEDFLVQGSPSTPVCNGAHTESRSVARLECTGMISAHRNLQLPGSRGAFVESTCLLLTFSKPVDSSSTSLARKTTRRELNGGTRRTRETPGGKH
ncbi:hypothetical protein AAY473_016481 [Plecturocebus cupreus]